MPPRAHPSRAAVDKTLKARAPEEWKDAFGASGTAYVKDRGVESAAASSSSKGGPGAGRSVPQPLHATPGVRIVAAKKPHASGGEVLSDLLGSSKRSASQPAVKRKEEPRSAAVERLENAIKDVEGWGEGGETALGKRALKKNKGGCFCQGASRPPHLDVCFPSLACTDEPEIVQLESTPSRPTLLSARRAVSLSAAFNSLISPARPASTLSSRPSLDLGSSTLSAQSSTPSSLRKQPNVSAYWTRPTTWPGVSRPAAASPPSPLGFSPRVFQARQPLRRSSTREERSSV